MPHVVLKDHLHHLTEYEGKGTKSLIFKLFSELRKTLKCNLGFSATPISHLFYELGKTWKYTQPKTNISTSDILNLWMNWERLCPNLSFTDENKMGNLHEKWWSHFKHK